jgi:type I restriction enzyme S subunit
MPKNWKTYKLSEALEIKYGKDHKKVSDGDIPIYGTGGIMRFGNQFLYDDESILIPRKGSLNNIYYLNKPFWTVDTLFWSKINKEIVFPKYLFYNLKILDFANMDVGTAIPSLTTKLLNKIEVNIPPLPEQKAIANILSTIDDKIENNLAVNKTLEDMAMALYKHWFVDFGPFQDGEFIDSELGLIPKGWEMKSVYSIAQFVNGAAFKSKDFLDNRSLGLPVIKIVEIKQGITSQTKYSNKELDEKYVIKNNDILFPWSGNPHTSLGIHLWDKGKAFLNQHIFVVRVNDSNSKCFVFNTLKNLLPTFVNLATHKQTTGLGHITVSNLKELKISIPNNKIIKKYENVASPLMKKIYNNQIESNKLTKFRDTLLPMLISGEVRLKEFQEEIENVM